jgi:hypothetical protein
MGTYQPTFEWREQTRALDAKCQTCGRELHDTSVSAVRAHLMAWPTHVMRVAAVTTTIVSKPREGEGQHVAA